LIAIIYSVAERAVNPGGADAIVIPTAILQYGKHESICLLHVICLPSKGWQPTAMADATMLDWKAGHPSRCEREEPRASDSSVLAFLWGRGSLGGVWFLKVPPCLV
jgi:hypothetical protein